MAVRKKLTEQVKQLSARVTKLKCEVAKGKESVVDRKVKLKAVGKRAEDAANERDGLQARLQKSQPIMTRRMKTSLASVTRLIVLALD